VYDESLVEYPGGSSPQWHRCHRSHDPQDLAAYLDFLEGIGAFDWKKADASLYLEEFRL